MSNIALMFKTRWSSPFVGAAVVTGLYASSLYNYLLFHTLVELFSVLTAFAIFALAWNTRRIIDSHYLLFIGIASLFTGALDLLHTLAYKGMGVFPDSTANLPTQLWIAFRFLFSISFLLAALFIRKKPNVRNTFIVYTFVLSALIVSIFQGWFPDCFIEGKGLTRFKIVSEYGICLIFLASLGLLILKRQAFNPWVLRLMILSHLCSIAAELSFTQYISVYGFSNMLGHLFLLASVALIYRAIVVTGMAEPSELLFRNLKQSEEAIRASETKYRLLFENMINGFAYHRIITDEKGRPVDYVFLEVNDAFEKMTGLKREAILGKGVREVLPGIERDPADWIGLYGEVALLGREVHFEQHAEPLNKWYSVLAYSPMPGHFVTIFEDVTERKRTEKKLLHAHDELETRVRERTAELAQANQNLEQEITVRRETERRTRLTNELLKLFTRKFSRKEYLDVAVELIRDWSGCAHAGIRIADRNGNIPYKSCVGYNKDFLATEHTLSLREDHCICTRVAVGAPESSELAAMTPLGSFYSNETLQFVDGLSSEHRSQYRGVCMRQGFRSLAVTPIKHGDTILGAIHLADERAGRVPLGNVEFIEQLALIIGEALFRFGVEEDLMAQREELVRMNEQLRNLSAHVDAVREGERMGIAREIHDELGQVLTAIKMDVSWLRKRLAVSQKKLAGKAGESVQLIDAAIQSVKRISAELRPGILDDIGLTAALEWAAKDFEKRTRIPCKLTISPETLSVDRTRSTALFRILQESLTNIIRHARATEVRVSLEEKDRTIVLTVADNGKGIKKEELSAPHSFGLIGMRERVQFLGGQLTIRGANNRGTVVTVALPVDSKKELQPVPPVPGTAP